MLPEVVCAVLDECLPGMQPTRYDILQQLWSGYGNIYRVELTSPSLENRTTVIIKHVNPPFEDFPSLSHRRKLKSYHVELNFYKQMSSHDHKSLSIPKLLGFRQQDNETVFILQDLCTIGFSDRGNYSISDTEACIRWLARFHKYFLTDGSKKVITDVWEQGAYWHLSTRPDEWNKMSNKDPLKKLAFSIDEILKASKYKTLVHGDAKMANFCFPKIRGSTVAAVDFQYCGWACGIVDVAYCIHGWYGEDEKHLLALYFKELDASEEVENEWKSLFPFAVADFERFLVGWSGSTRNNRDDLQIIIHTVQEQINARIKA